MCCPFPCLFFTFKADFLQLPAAPFSLVRVGVCVCAHFCCDFMQHLTENTWKGVGRKANDNDYLQKTNFHRFCLRDVGASGLCYPSQLLL